MPVSEVRDYILFWNQDQEEEKRKAEQEQVKKGRR